MLWADLDLEMIGTSFSKKKICFETNDETNFYLKFWILLLQIKKTPGPSQ